MTVSKKLCAVLVGAACLAPAAAHAGEEKPGAEQQAMMEAFAKMAAVGDNHKLLASMAGEWTFENKMWMDPSQPPQVTGGTASNEMTFGGRYLHSRQVGAFMGQTFEGVGISAYDNLKQQFVSIWSDNMSTGIYYQTGSYDPATKTITYHGETPDPMAPGTLTKIRSTTRLVDADTFVFDWYETREGQEVRTMEITYKRKK